MSWFNVFGHDLRGGILRRRNLLVPLLFCIPCVDCFRRLGGTAGSWMDYLMHCFRGAPPPASIGSFEFPILWLLILGGCMFLNLDYPLNDLTDAGLQVIVRTRRRRDWFLSKCAWNLLSCAVYVLLGALTAWLFALLFGDFTSCVNTPGAAERTLGIYVADSLPVGQALLVAVVLPYLSIAALNMLQMSLSLVMKPIFSFLICTCLLLCSAFIHSPFLPGSGAMVVRNGILVEGMLPPLTIALTCLGIIMISIIIGIVRFQRTDFLRYEG